MTDRAQVQTLPRSISLQLLAVGTVSPWEGRTSCTVKATGFWDLNAYNPEDIHQRIDYPTLKTKAVRRLQNVARYIENYIRSQKTVSTSTQISGASTQ
jgi:hypothetical protein